MRSFCFIDKISQQVRGESLTAYFTLKGNEEFLQDHFAGFPVMPGVLMIEALRQAGQALLACSEDFREPFSRLARLENVKFGRFLPPGSLLKIAVRLVEKKESASFFEGQIYRVDPEQGETRALTASFTLLPAVSDIQVKRSLEASSRQWHGPLVV